MSGGYRSDGGSSSGSGWGGQSTANPSITSQFGGGSSSNSSSGSSSAPAAIQSKVEAKVDAKNPTNNDGQPGSLTGQGLAGPVAAKNADYWSGPTDGWRANTNYTAGKAGKFGSEEANAANLNAIKNKTATEGQIETAKAQVAGWNTVNARDSVSGLLGFMGGAAAGPIGGYAAGKAAGFGAEKLSDYTSGFKDNPAYSASKQLAEDDSSFLGTVAGKISPVGTGGIVRSAINDATGTYRQDMARMQQALREKGHISAPANAQQAPNSSSSSSGSLLANMYQTQQQPAVSSADYSTPALNYDNNASYYRGSVY